MVGEGSQNCPSTEVKNLSIEKQKGQTNPWYDMLANMKTRSKPREF